MLFDRLTVRRALAKIVLAAALVCLSGFNALASPGDAKTGRQLFLKYCYQCHGYEGKGDGPAAIYQAARPRDFTAGVFKIKTSPPGALIPRDEDIFNTITRGMPGSGMPRWENILSEKERWDLVAYIKTLSDIFEGEADPPAMDYSGKIPYSEESAKRGEWVYNEFKCPECHGPEGRGPAIKVLKDDYGYRIWPRDLTKPWTFIGPYTPEDLYARVTNGIPLTPMPSFVPRGKDTYMQKRWDVVNYVLWLGKQAAKQRRRYQIEMGVITAISVGAFIFFAWPVVMGHFGFGGKRPPGKNDHTEKT